MKKILALMLAAALVLSLVACGGGAGGNTPSGGNEDNTNTSSSENPQTLALNNTATSGDWKFTLTDIEFGDSITNNITDPNTYLRYYLRPADEEYRSEGNTYLPADKGQTFMFFTATLAYSGKTTAEIASIGTVSTNHLGFEARYGDGYTFDTYEFAIIDGNGYGFSSSNTFEPLGSDRECRGYFKVPSEVQNNSGNSLELVITFYEADEPTDSFVYNLR